MPKILVIYILFNIPMKSLIVLTPEEDDKNMKHGTSFNYIYNGCYTEKNCYYKPIGMEGFQKWGQGFSRSRFVHITAE